MKFLTGMIYDTIISNQSEFDDWVSQMWAGTYKGTSCCILEGTYTRSDSLGIQLSNNLKVLHGFGKVTISFSNFSYNSSTNPAMIFYNLSLRPSAEYEICNIAVTGSTTSSPYRVDGFYNCINLTNCSASGYGSSGAHGFVSCTNLTNCTAAADGYGAVQFDSCTNLVGCISASTENSSEAFYRCKYISNAQVKGGARGFNTCSYLTNCIAYLDGPSSSSASLYAYGICDHLNNCYGNTIGHYHDTAYAFYRCTQMSNCSGAAVNSNSGAVSFYGCSQCTNCGQASGAVSKTIWSSCTNVDKDTCPEYTG